MRSWTSTATAAAALVCLVVAAFVPAWVRGESLMAALGAPGVTPLGPVGASTALPAQAPPLADGVAAFIDEPLAALTAAQQVRGELPLWNPHNGLGVPLLGNWQTSIPSPLRLLVQHDPRWSWSYDLTYVVRLVVAALGAFALALQLGLPTIGAFAAGLAFGLTGYFVRYLSMHHLNAEVWLPWLWLGVERLARRPSLLAVLGHAAVVYCIIVGGNPQPTLLAALTTGLLVASRLREYGAVGLLRVVLVSAAAVLLAAPYWLAGLEYVREAVHHHSDNFGGDAYTAAGALGFLVPQPLARPGSPCWGEVAPYLGLSAVVLAGFGLGRGLGRSVLLWALLVGCAGKIAGLPGTGWLGTLPGLELIKLFKYLHPAAALALALLAGAGVAALAAGSITPGRSRLVVALAAALTALLTAAALHADADLQYLSFTATPRLLLLAALAAALLALPYLRARAGLAAVALLALELGSAIPGSWPKRLEPWAKPGFLAAWKTDNPGSFRTFGAYGMWIPNQNAAYGVDDLRLHDGVFPRRYAAFVKRFIDPNVRHWPVFTAEDLGTQRDTILPGLELANRLLPQAVAQDMQPSTVVNLFASEPSELAPVAPARFLDLVNVKYLVLPASWAPAADAMMAAAGTRDRHAEVYRDADAVVFERKTALPRAFFPRRAVAVADAEAAFAAMAEPGFDPRAVALVESASASGLEPTTGSAFVEPRPNATDLILTAQCAGQAWLVISVYPYPGLRAELLAGDRDAGGPQALEVVPADGTLSAVLLPRGRHRLRLYYEPTWHGQALLLRWVGALVLLGSAIWVRRRRAAMDHQ